jgi:hypothetical protein
MGLGLNLLARGCWKQQGLQLLQDGGDAALGLEDHRVRLGLEPGLPLHHHFPKPE